MQSLFWILDGLAAGWLTGKLISSEGRDWVMDIVMGVAGAVTVGFLLNATHLLVQGKLIYTNLAAILGGAVLTVLSRYVGGRREYGSEGQANFQGISPRKSPVSAGVSKFTFCAVPEKPEETGQIQWPRKS